MQVPHSSPSMPSSIRVNLGMLSSALPPQTRRGAYWAKEVTEKAQLYLSSIKSASALADEGLVGRVDPEAKL